MILTSTSNNQTVKPVDKPRGQLGGIYWGCLQLCVESEWEDPGLEFW
jgi:hypothetical protein